MAEEVKDENPYQLLLDYMNDSLESFPDDEELNTIVNMAVRLKSWQKNKGIRVHRLEHPGSYIEKAFHDQWLKDNYPDKSTSFGHGILQDLFIESKSHPFAVNPKTEVIEIITDRDRKIVATVIQWLGTNIGQCFLHESLRRVNARIVFDKPETDK
jgi:hypothetical protein